MPSVYNPAPSDLGSKVKQADETISNSNVLHNDNELVLPVAANEVALVIIGLRLTILAASDFKFAFTLPAGATLSGIYALDIAPIASAATVMATHDLTSALALVGDATDGFYFVFMVYRGAAAAGNLQLQWAQNTAVVENTTVKAGSYLLKVK